MSAGAFGAAACRDRGFVASLRDGRSPRLGTVDRALAVMGEPPAGPAFRRECDAAASGSFPSEETCALYR